MKTIRLTLKWSIALIPLLAYWAWFVIIIKNDFTVSSYSFGIIVGFFIADKFNVLANEFNLWFISKLK